MTPKEITEWLDSLGLEGEERTAVEATLTKTPERAEKAKESFMLKSAFTQKTQALADEKRRFGETQAEWETRTNQYTEELATWKQGLETKLQDAVKQLEESKLRGAALESKVRSVANEFGLNADELLTDVKDVHAAKREEPNQPPPQIDLSGYLKKGEADELARLAVTLPVQMQQFYVDYQRLHGKPFDGDLTQLMQEAMMEGIKRKVPVRDYLAEKFEFSKKRDEQAAAQRAAEIADAVKEAETRVRSEFAGQRPVNQPAENVSPFLKKPEPKTDAPARGSVQQDMQRRQAAYADFERRRNASQERAAS